MRSPCLSAVLALVSVAGLVAMPMACGSDDKDEKDMAVDKGLPDTRVNEPFGRSCTNLGQPCKDPDPAGYPLWCIGIQGGTGGKGFCSRSCSDVGNECYGTPNGQSASCFISGSAGDAGETKFCGFLCKAKERTWTCPGILTCGKPDKDGTAVCLQ